MSVFLCKIYTAMKIIMLSSIEQLLITYSEC